MQTFEITKLKIDSLNAALRALQAATKSVEHAVESAGVDMYVDPTCAALYDATEKIGQEIQRLVSAQIDQFPDFWKKALCQTGGD